MKISVEVEGLNEALARLKALGANADSTLLDAVEDLTVQTHAFAVQGIQRGPKSGRTYTRRGVTHTASAPGQYPASDTGTLASSVQMVLPAAGDRSGQVGTNVAYGAHLEFGTSRMAARPWLLPSFERAKIGVEQELKARFMRGV